jgi:hypothetical protein
VPRHLPRKKRANKVRALYGLNQFRPPVIYVTRRGLSRFAAPRRDVSLAPTGKSSRSQQSDRDRGLNDVVCS